MSLRSLHHFRALPPRKGKYQPLDVTVPPPRSWMLTSIRTCCPMFFGLAPTKGKRMGLGPFRHDKFRGREPSIGYLMRKEAAFA